MIKKEPNLTKKPLTSLIGVDEAGRGCLAGPVFAAAVSLSFPQKFKDSKLLSEKKRQEQAEIIKKNHLFFVAQASLREIEELNILKASLLAMKRAVLGLNLKKGEVMVDGKFLIPDLKGYSQEAIIGGDKKVSAIAAASILAKTTRDDLLKDLSLKYPGFGFEKHKGYGTKFHKERIKTLGPSPIHRRSFAGVKEHLR